MELTSKTLYLFYFIQFIFTYAEKSVKNMDIVWTVVYVIIFLNASQTLRHTLAIITKKHHLN